MGQVVRLTVEYAYIPQSKSERENPYWRGRAVMPDGSRVLFMAPREDIKTMRKAIEEGRSVEVDLPEEYIIGEM